jgi:hypothetical protein
MKNGRPEGEDAESMPVHSDLRSKHQTGDSGGRPSWRSSFLGAPGAKFFMGLVEKDRAQVFGAFYVERCLQPGLNFPEAVQ